MVEITYKNDHWFSYFDCINSILLSLENNDKYSEILDDIFSSSLLNKAPESIQKQRKTPKKKSPKKKWDEQPKKPKSAKKKLFKSSQDKENFGTPQKPKNVIKFITSQLRISI